MGIQTLTLCICQTLISNNSFSIKKQSYICTYVHTNIKCSAVIWNYKKFYRQFYKNSVYISRPFPKSCGHFLESSSRWKWFWCHFLTMISIDGEIKLSTMMNMILMTIEIDIPAAPSLIPLLVTLAYNYCVTNHYWSRTRVWGHVCRDVTYTYTHHYTI